MDERDYWLAKKTPEYRQEFLENVDIEMYAPYVREIIYFEGGNGDRIMATETGLIMEQSINIFSKIRVSDYAFGKYSWNEFCNVLIPHEGLHALQNYFESPRLLERRKLNFRGRGDFYCSEQEIRQEIEAHRNQIDHHTFSKCSREFQKEVCEYLDFYESL